MTHGDIELAASADIGSMGPKEGPVVVVSWRIGNTLFPFSPLLILLLMLALKPNRKPSALWILAPCVLILFVMSALQLEFMVGGIATEPFSKVYLGFAVVLLSAHRFRDFGGIRTLLMSAAIMLAAGIVASLFDTGFSISDDALRTAGANLAVFSAFAAATIIPLALAQFFSRWSTKRGPFVRTYFVCQVSFVVVLAILMTLLATIFDGRPEMPLILAVPIAAMWIGGYGVGLFLLVLPFFALSFLVPFYGERFDILLNRTEKAASVSPVNPSTQDAAPEEDM